MKNLFGSKKNIFLLAYYYKKISIINNRPCLQTLPACHIANFTSLRGSIYVANAESGDDSIYNMSRPTMKENLLFIFSRRFFLRNNLSPCFFPKEKIQGEENK